jgi:hypothetical protein
LQKIETAIETLTREHKLEELGGGKGNQIRR